MIAKSPSMEMMRPVVTRPSKPVERLSDSSSRAAKLSPSAAADAMVEEVCQALGAGLAIIVNGLNPERVLLAGSVAKSLRPLEARLRASLARYAFAEALRSTQLEILSLDKDATVRGGAALVHYETRYETPRRRTTTP